MLGPFIVQKAKLKKVKLEGVKYKAFSFKNILLLIKCNKGDSDNCVMA